MRTMKKRQINLCTVNSPIGEKNIDFKGAPISGVRIDTSKAYDQIASLLQQYINHYDDSAWRQIVTKIDYIYSNLDHVLAKLDEETSFSNQIHSELRRGKKLLLKPNLVAPSVIDSVTKGEGSGAPICTEWPLVAALMRWFHDKLAIDYCDMTLGEASTSTFLLASAYSQSSGKTITPEAVIEGKSGDFYGGWGFFFVRKYLTTSHPSNHLDNPMNGHEESVSGNYIPPGKCGNKLMVYDLNKVESSSSRGRTLSVPEGINFHTITMHKAVVGGDPHKKDDLEAYPGCILINVPKLKIHAQDLITNAIKNLGIGLYPGQCTQATHNHDTSWKYAYPSNQNPTLKAKLPHSPWVLELDEKTLLPLKDEQGNTISTKTGGFSGTQTDILKVLQTQNIFILHIIDAINIVNISHNPDGKSVKIPEGYIWSSLDCVALDLFCARYCFKTVPMQKALKLKKENNYPTEFMHFVPVATPSGKNIVTTTDVDSPLFRYSLYDFAEKRGIGQKQYYVMGLDSLTQTPLASVEGHLGRIEDSTFIELMTDTLYYNPSTFIHDLQKTALSYALSSDQLTSSTVYNQIMNLFDENKDGIIDYDEKGKGFETALLIIDAYTTDFVISDPYGTQKRGFMFPLYLLKNSNKHFNSNDNDFTQERLIIQALDLAYNLSQLPKITPDYFVPGMFFGKGMWPSWLTVIQSLFINHLYGSRSPSTITLNSCYGCAFQYADKVLNNGAYTQSINQSESDSNAINNYFEAVSKGASPLNFIFFVPSGYGRLMNLEIPNVVETDDPEKLFLAYFNQVDFNEIWDTPHCKTILNQKNIAPRKENSMFKFDPNKLYLMPPFFGGYDFHDALSTDVTSLNFTLTTDGNRLAEYLPEGFTLLRPELNISYVQQRGVQFLSGGAYNLLNISVPVRFTGMKDQLEGIFPLVVWENDARPITGGREQSGQPKIFADIQDLQSFGDDYFANASYQNNTFINLGISNPQPVDKETLQQLNSSLSSYNVFGWRYIPNVGGFGAALSEPILYPQSQTLTQAFTGKGTLNWTKLGANQEAYQSDIILQSNIIAQLADLPILSMQPVLMTKGSILMKPLTGRVLR